MKFTVSKASPESFRSEIIALGCYEREPEEGQEAKRPVLIKRADGGIALDRAMGGAISKQIQAERFTGERGTHRLLFTAGKIPARFVLLIGLGPRGKHDLEILREAGAEIARAAREVRAVSVALVLEQGEIGEDAASARARAIAEGVVLGSYRFLRYRTSPESPAPHALTTLLHRGDAGAVRDALAQGKLVAEAELLCRDLVNLAPGDATPSIIAQRAKELASAGGLDCQLWGPEEIRKARMHGLAAVARGSAEPPAHVTLRFKPAETPRARLALVGKGVTFDSGGISLKPPKGMERMKDDMAGAAVVLAAMRAIAKLRPLVEVTAHLPLVENLPDGKALRPGEVITSRNGKTIEIITTDAEGRIILADALDLAAESRPDAIIDLATLTGGAAYCCGELYSLVMGNDQRLIDRLRRAAEATGERLWQLPLVEEYREGFTSGIADLNNSGKSKAQAIVGGLFLRDFVGGIPWVHVDIGASAWTEDGLPLAPKGATGAMVRTLIDFVMHFKKSVADAAGVE